MSTMNEINQTVEAIVNRNGFSKVKYLVKRFNKELVEEDLEEQFYVFMDDLKVDIDSDEFEIITNGGGMLSDNEMIKVIELFSEFVK